MPVGNISVPKFCTQQSVGKWLALPIVVSRVKGSLNTKEPDENIRLSREAVVPKMQKTLTCVSNDKCYNKSHLIII